MQRDSIQLSGYRVSVLFEDNDILAVEKPEGLATIPERASTQPSLHRLVEEAVGVKIYVVHRLDKEVSGVLLFAKNAAAHRSLNDQFCDRKIRKCYLALVLGSIDQKATNLVIDTPIRQFGSGRMGIDSERGKSSVTELKVLSAKEGFSYTEAYPLTGRRHQIRVHLYSIGHPIAGDPLYGDKKIQCSFQRLMLHAHTISCTLPNGTPITLRSQPAGVFAEIVSRCIGSPCNGQ